MKAKPSPTTSRTASVRTTAGPATRPPPPADGVAYGPRARMMRMLLDTALRLMADGFMPSVAELARAAGVSRATAYRYFPTQDALVAAVANAGLDPLQQWRPGSQGAAERVDELLAYIHPHLEAQEAPLRAALRLSLQQAAQPGATPAPPGLQRLEALAHALQPLDGRLGAAGHQRLMQALSLLCGPESFLVFKDIWHLPPAALLELLRWMAQAMVQRALREAPRPARQRADRPA